MKRIATALSKVETQALQEFSRHHRMVEAGALLGYSTLKMAEVAARVVSIDKHRGYGPDTLSKYMSNIEGKLDIVKPVVGDCMTNLPLIKGDRYFVDLDGKYHTIKRVLELLPIRTPIAIHDFGRQNCSGVEQALKDMNCRITTVVDTLAIVEKSW